MKLVFWSYTRKNGAKVSEMVWVGPDDIAPPTPLIVNDRPADDVLDLITTVEHYTPGQKLTPLMAGTFRW